VSAQQLDVGDSPMQSCCCPPTVQAEHRCCCSAGASVVVRSQSCCTDPKDSSTPAPDGQRKQPEGLGRVALAEHCLGRCFSRVVSLDC
jgi:hypothetical protein